MTRALLLVVAAALLGCSTPAPVALCLNGQIVRVDNGTRTPTGRQCAPLEGDSHD
jgi:hypothetical protein